MARTRASSRGRRYIFLPSITLGAVPLTPSEAGRMASSSDNPLKRLIAEIHRRSLWQVLRGQRGELLRRRKCFGGGASRPASVEEWR